MRECNVVRMGVRVSARDSAGHLEGGKVVKVESEKEAVVGMNGSHEDVLLLSSLLQLALHFA